MKYFILFLVNFIKFNLKLKKVEQSFVKEKKLYTKYFDYNKQQIIIFIYRHFVVIIIIDTFQLKFKIFLL